MKRHLSDRMVENYLDISLDPPPSDSFSIESYSELEPGLNEATMPETSTDGLKRELIKIIVKYLSTDENTRKVCISIVKDMFGFIRLFVNDLLQGINLESSNNGASLVFSELERLINDAEMTSEHNIFKELKKIGAYVNYEIKTIRKNVTLHQDNSGVRTEEIKVDIFFLNLELVLKSLFNIPAFFTQIFDYLIYLNAETEVVSNIMQTDFWKQTISGLNNENGQTLYLALIAYFDEFEPLNALGAHSSAYKVGGVYVKLGCLPPKWQSSLDFIFTLALFFSNDRAKVTNESMFKSLVQLLNHLFVTGIEVKSQTIINKIKFVVVVFTGDNLGVNQTQDFCANFSMANFMCRICRCHRDVIHVQEKEDENSLRTLVNYLEDSAYKNVTDTGIHCYSVFNLLKQYNVVDNNCVDIMHDFLEGVAHYDLAFMLENFIESRFFNLDWLNLQLFKFDYGKIKNRPDCISTDMLMKKKFKFTASEMKTFLLSLNLIIGEKIPKENEM